MKTAITIVAAIFMHPAPLHRLAKLLNAVPPSDKETQVMTQFDSQIRHLLDELPVPVSGRQSTVLLDDTQAKVVLFVFAAGSGLTEHIAPLPALIQIIQGQAELTVGDKSVAGKAGTWIQMAAKTPHSIKAHSPVTMLLTLLK